MAAGSNWQDENSQQKPGFQKSKGRKKKTPNVHDQLRLPPQNLDAERGVLGSIMLLNEAIDDVGEIIKQDYFYSDAHQKIYNSIRHLHENNVRGIDAVTLAN